MDTQDFAAIPIDASGAFQFGTSLPLDGTSDGFHSIDLQVTDIAGSVGSLLTPSSYYSYYLVTLPTTTVTEDGNGKLVLRLDP